jgi:PIN domain nuclease of toxin-antitoxin system
VIAALEDRLRRDERAILDRQAWTIAAIVLWEVAHLARDGRIAIQPSDPRLRTLLETMTVWPIDLQVVNALRLLDFRSDPADELIAATSVVMDVPLLTRDTRMLASRVVPLALR